MKIQNHKSLDNFAIPSFVDFKPKQNKTKLLMLSLINLSFLYFLKSAVRFILSNLKHLITILKIKRRPANWKPNLISSSENIFGILFEISKMFTSNLLIRFLYKRLPFALLLDDFLLPKRIIENWCQYCSSC